jgi:hypothetical protein
MNSVDHVKQAAQALAKGPASAKERKKILEIAPELGQYVCRQCGVCSPDLMEIFRLEGYIDRQMIDYLPHNPAEYALRVRLSGWFTMGDIARERFSQTAYDLEALSSEAGAVDCPFQIDVARKTKLAIAKLRGEKVNTI